MKNLIIAFAGAVGTGKSELSASVASNLGWPRVSFGDYIRSVACQRNLPITRRNLQTLGAAIIQERGWENYCRSVLAQAQWDSGQSVILDGLRHSEALYALKNIVSPMEVILVRLELDDRIRQARLRTRDCQIEDNLEELDSHSTEVQVTGILKTLADLILDSNQSIGELTSEVLAYIRERQELG